MDPAVVVQQQGHHQLRKLTIHQPGEVEGPSNGCQEDPYGMKWTRTRTAHVLGDVAMEDKAEGEPGPLLA